MATRSVIPQSSSLGIWSFRRCSVCESFGHSSGNGFFHPIHQLNLLEAILHEWIDSTWSKRKWDKIDGLPNNQTKCMGSVKELHRTRKKSVHTTLLKVGKESHFGTLEQPLYYYTISYYPVLFISLPYLLPSMCFLSVQIAQWYPAPCVGCFAAPGISAVLLLAIPRHPLVLEELRCQRHLWSLWSNENWNASNVSWYFMIFFMIFPHVQEWKITFWRLCRPSIGSPHKVMAQDAEENKTKLMKHESMSNEWMIQLPLKRVWLDHKFYSRAIGRVKPFPFI